ncbi:MAG: cyclic nucleotide-binding domain-containing protein, partial [Planctomycetes bacterium]|nr:cyclic nucleotide-binding domain-containing protein [Planctomycetota bacterium]
PFYTWVEDYIQGSPLADRRDPATGLPVLRYENFDDVRLYGVEASARVSLHEHLQVRGQLGYVRGRNHSSHDDLYRIAPLRGALALDLEELLVSVERAAGKKYAWRALASGFDRLDWEIQELIEDHVLKYTRHAAGLSNELTAARNDLDILLRSVPLFISLTEEDLSALAKRFVPQRFERGEEIVRAGDSGDSFYVIRVGRAEVLSADGERLNNLGRG